MDGTVIEVAFKDELKGIDKITEEIDLFLRDPSRYSKRRRENLYRKVMAKSPSRIRQKLKRSLFPQLCEMAREVFDYAPELRGIFKENCPEPSLGNLRKFLEFTGKRLGCDFEPKVVYPYALSRKVWQTLIAFDADGRKELHRIIIKTGNKLRFTKDDFKGYVENYFENELGEYFENRKEFLKSWRSKT